MTFHFLLTRIAAMAEFEIIRCRQDQEAILIEQDLNSIEGQVVKAGLGVFCTRHCKEGCKAKRLSVSTMTYHVKNMLNHAAASVNSERIISE